ncbi:leucine-rich repeat-containing protein 15 [Biomphalaria glabrata]|uniref:Leucine-rich repeat-containing protein 15-like n=1 Tax=Biomphalaria glabrata TaxID=6526 RepID=A0A9U8DYJ5_BIOGL|nr:leucine-rich repeat-containing protein 15-like [Biomphalaria glabrata]KAI8743362.1 leucine-rich repeat-containing protein 15-like [Biomphalaria glabrata]
MMLHLRKQYAERMLHLVLIFVLMSVAQSGACPSACTCWEYHVDCYGRQLQFIPEDTPLIVKKLELQENEIQDLNREMLIQFQDLENIFLKNNQISEIKPKTFANISSLESINLENNLIKDIAEDGFYNLSSLQIVDLSYNQLSEISEQFKNVPSLQRLNLNSNQLTSLKEDSFTHLRNLVYLTLSDNQISQITNAAFEGMEKLSYLVLSGNPLKTVDNIFQQLEALTFLDISRCRLRQFPTGLPWTLRSLNISNNYLMIIKVTDLSTIRHINSLDFGNNQIRFIEHDAFSKAPYLTEIRLSGNQLVQLPLRIPKTVLTFLAEGNKIEKIYSNNFDHDSVMSTFSLYNNSISEIDAYTFSRLINLTTLNLGSNQISMIKSFTFAGLRQLTCLNLERNPIVTIKDRAFASLFRVKTLKLSSIKTNVSDMAENVFQDLSSLNSLDIQSSPYIAHKIITSATVIRTFYDLWHLNLKNNGLKNLPMEIRAGLNSLKGIQLSDNPWECDNKMLAFKNWMNESPKLFTDQVICASPYNLQGRSVKDIDPKEFTAPTVEPPTTPEMHNFTVTNTSKNVSNDSNATEFTTQNLPDANVTSSRQWQDDKKVKDTTKQMDKNVMTLSTNVNILTDSRLFPSATLNKNEITSSTPEINVGAVDKTNLYRPLAPTSVFKTTEVDSTLTTLFLYNSIQLQSSFESVTTQDSTTQFTESMPWTSFSMDTVMATSIHVSSTPAADASSTSYSDEPNNSGPISFNSRGRNAGDNRLPTFSASPGSRMQVTIIGVAVSLLTLVAALLTAVAVVHCRRRRKRLPINDEQTFASTNETSDTVFIVRHMASEPIAASTGENEGGTTPGEKASSTSLSSSSSSKLGSKFSRQRSSTSSSSKTSFDCIHGSKDDDSEMLMYSWK